MAYDPNRCVVKVSVSNTSKISAWFNSDEVKNAVKNFIGTSVTATGGTVKLENLDFCFYYISSTLGATATITNVKNGAVAIDKNQTPGWGDGDDAGKRIVKDDGTLAYTDTAAIGDNVNFKVTVNNALNYSKADKIKEYIINDIEGSAVYKDLDKDSDTGHAIDKTDTTTNEENCNWCVVNDEEDNDHFYIHINWQNSDGSFRYVKEDGTPDKALSCCRYYVKR